jgi:hypothetical protein
MADKVEPWRQSDKEGSSGSIIEDRYIEQDNERSVRNKESEQLPACHNKGRSITPDLPRLAGAGLGTSCTGMPLSELTLAGTVADIVLDQCCRSGARRSMVG